MTVVTSTQHATLSALVGLASASLPLPAYLVVDGPYNDQVSDQVDTLQRLFIGADTAEPGETVTAVDGEQDFQNTGTRNRNEIFFVHCTATALDPNGSMSTARGQASALFAVLEVALRGTNTSPNAANINGAVRYSEIKTNQILQSYIDGGAFVEWRFDIRCTAYLQQI